MQDAKEEVRSKLSIEDVIGEYVQLKRAGRNFKGLSPFSGERTPSFYVSPEKNIWHDFSSNKGGDVFSFIMEVEGLDFRQALEFLAQKVGVDLSLYDSKAGQEVAQQKKRLRAALDLATNYYQQSLVKNQHALEYVFKKRGLSKEIVQEFKIGYAPDTSDALVQFLIKKGFSKKDIAAAGLTNRFGGDLFRSRMMVPLMDGAGQVIGFTGRLLSDGPNAPKYLNTPQTLLYDKGRHVFGLSQAKEAIRRDDYAVIVEGNMDVVSSHQVGVQQVVATAGTALTEFHLKALVRLTGQVRLSFDADAAGLAATERAIPIAQKAGVELSIITVGEGAKDPDELIKKDPSLWQQAIEKAEPVVDWVLSQYSKREDLMSASGKREFTTAALRVVSSLEDAVEREHYMRKIAEYTHSSLEALTQKLQDTPSAREVRPLKQVKQEGELVAPDTQAYQDSLLALFSRYPFTRELMKDASVEMFATEERQSLFSYLIAHPDEVFEDAPENLKKIETYVKIELLKAETRYGDWNDQDRFVESARLLRQLATEHKQQQKNKLTANLREAQEQGDEERAKRIMQTLNTLIKEISDGKR